MLEHPLLAPELTDAVGAVEVGRHQDVEEFGAGSRPSASRRSCSRRSSRRASWHGG